MNITRRVFCATLAGSALPAAAPRDAFDPARFRRYNDEFNRRDLDTAERAIGNSAVWEWLSANVPLFECPDRDIEEIYWYRWWTYRKHIRATPDGFVITEFLPDVNWAGKHNTISCAAGHHIYEGRWIQNKQYLDDYSVFWFRKGGDPRRYSFWAADAIYARYLADGRAGMPVSLLPDLMENYAAWEKTHLDANGLFWQTDNRDGMEVSIGGSGCRATINSYMYGDAVAIARIAEMAGRAELASRYRAKAAQIKSGVERLLWDEAAGFYKVLPRGEGQALAGVRELHGYVPWYFHLPEASHAVAWKHLMDPQGFAARFGPTTAERRHPRFFFEDKHECLWNGPSWPYATTQTLVALANLLNSQEQGFVSKRDYLGLLRTYAMSQHLKTEDGSVIPWIDEDLHPDTGEWIARGLLHKLGRADKDRGRYYNHSTFADLIITGLVGLRPRADETVEVNPLVPEGAWDYFRLDGIPYHGRRLAIIYDRTGRRYHGGRGLRVLVEGRQVAASNRLDRVTGALPEKT
jgi:hypothetical protein